MCYWLYNRSMENTASLARREIQEQAAAGAGQHAGHEGRLQLLRSHRSVSDQLRNSAGETRAGRLPQHQRQCRARAGLRRRLAKSRASNLFLGSYPITPASDILHELSQYKDFGVITFQAEDEIAAITSAIGAAYAGALGHYHHFRPGHGAENRSDGPRRRRRIAAGRLRHSARRPVHRPADQNRTSRSCFKRSTAATPKRRFPFSRPPPPAIASGSPSKPAASPSNTWCPVIILSDGYLANGAEPWKIPNVDELPEIPVNYETNPVGFQPYKRDPDTLARPWAIPGTPGLEHRIGGIEKQDVTGNINYEPLNHEHMVRTPRRKSRSASRRKFRKSFPKAIESGDLLIVAWGSTNGPITAAHECPARKRPQNRPRSSAPPESAAAQSRRRAQALQTKFWSPK